jgi:hypothetical protein
MGALPPLALPLLGRVGLPLGRVGLLLGGVGRGPSRGHRDRRLAGLGGCGLHRAGNHRQDQCGQAGQEPTRHPPQSASGGSNRVHDLEVTPSGACPQRW